MECCCCEERITNSNRSRIKKLLGDVMEDGIVINIPIAIEKYSSQPIKVYPQPAYDYVVFEATDTNVSRMRVIVERNTNFVVWDSGDVSGNIVVWTPSYEFRPGIYRYKATCYKAGYSNTYVGYVTWNRPLEKEQYTGTSGGVYCFYSWVWIKNTGQQAFNRHEIRYIINAIHEGGTTYNLVNDVFPSTTFNPGDEQRLFSPQFRIPSNAPYGLYDAQVIISNNNTGEEYIRVLLKNAWRVATHRALISYASTGVPRRTIVYKGRDYFTAAMSITNVGSGVVKLGGVITAEASGYVTEIFRFSNFYLEPGQSVRTPNEGYHRVLIPTWWPATYTKCCFYIWEERFNRNLDTIIADEAWLVYAP